MKGKDYVTFLLVSLLTLAEGQPRAVSDDASLRMALANPTVSHIRLLANVMASSTRPTGGAMTLNRSVLVEGTETSWSRFPQLDFNFATNDRIRLGPGVTLTIRRVAVLNVFTSSQLAYDYFAPTDALPAPVIVWEDVLDRRLLCPPLQGVSNAWLAAPRPAAQQQRQQQQLVSVENVTLCSEAESGRCFSPVMRGVDLEVDSGAGYRIRWNNTLTVCNDFISAACIQQLGTDGCFLSSFEVLLAQRAAAQNQQASSGSGGDGGGGGEGGGLSSGAQAGLIVGCVVGGVLLAGLVAGLLWARRRAGLQPSASERGSTNGADSCAADSRLAEVGCDLEANCKGREASGKGWRGSSTGGVSNSGFRCSVPASGGGRSGRTSGEVGSASTEERLGGGGGGGGGGGAGGGGVKPADWRAVMAHAKAANNPNAAAAAGAAAGAVVARSEGSASASTEMRRSPLGTPSTKAGTATGTAVGTARIISNPLCSLPEGVGSQQQQQKPTQHNSGVQVVGSAVLALLKSMISRAGSRTGTGSGAGSGTGMDSAASSSRVVSVAPEPPSGGCCGGSGAAKAAVGSAPAAPPLAALRAAVSPTSSRSASREYPNRAGLQAAMASGEGARGSSTGQASATTGRPSLSDIQREVDRIEGELEHEKKASVADRKHTGSASKSHKKKPTPAAAAAVAAVAAVAPLPPSQRPLQPPTSPPASEGVAPGHGASVDCQAPPQAPSGPPVLGRGV